MSRLKEHAIAFYSALTVFVAVQATAAQSDIAAKGHFAGLVKIGGDRKMYLECRGAGSPTVVFVSGLKGSAEDWKISTNQSDAAVFGEVAKFTRACVYDRCQWRAESPQKWRRKIPQFGGRGSAVGLNGASIVGRPSATF